MVKGILSEVFFIITFHLLKDVLLSTHISVVQAKEDEDANALKKEQTNKTKTVKEQCLQNKDMLNKADYKTLSKNAQTLPL